MVILRDDDRVARLAKIGQYISLLSIIILLGGLVLIFIGNENAIIFQLLALAVGYSLSQVGLHLQNRYVREPRADQVLDDALKHVAKDGRLYHYALPAPHVSLRDGKRRSPSLASQDERSPGSLPLASDTRSSAKSTREEEE